ncbi:MULTISPECIES: histone-like nucleoid-structuring protein Lsr2 [Gordonia]|uniref:Lsr2 family protein n=1 Tax=Gordonia jacobaea TaxID=122202 RepID=A0ABR5IF41_9ACTN|nr:MULTISPECIES: Lsr2 family protein [Gordonia]KNA92202.1 hypothetical protein ABW18_08735 [Gordonia jacobaea]
MAKKEIVQVIDDVDGKVLDEYETVRWSLDGKSYEFDTSSKHAQQFRDGLAKYISVSRASGSRSPKRVAQNGAGARSKEQTQAIRAWATKNGFEVSDRGRIPLNVLEAFEAAH